MKTYLLDTNILIHYFKDKYNVSDKIDEVGLWNCCISELTLAELKVGVELSKMKGYKVTPKFRRLVDVIKVIDISNAIDMFASESARLQLNGTPIHDSFDLMIGCSAVVNNMVLVTENLKDFKNIKGITIENWVNRPESK